MNVLFINYLRKIVKGGPSQRLNELLSFHPMYTVQSIFIHFLTIPGSMTILFLKLFTLCLSAITVYLMFQCLYILL